MPEEPSGMAARFTSGCYSSSFDLIHHPITDLNLQRTCLKDLRDVSSVQFLIGTAKYKWPCATFEVFTERENPAASYISSRSFNANVNSPESFKVANGWLKDCCANHTECQPPIQGFLPTRLLEVGQADAKLVKLISDYKDIPRNEAAYATLSYCWGNNQPFKTTKASLIQHQVSIMTSDLSQTLQDAIKVVRSLDLRFIWIDSLCIIQDDPQDIALEISRMSAYYENGHVSICASAAAGCNEGFLGQRKEEFYRYGPFELPYRGPDNYLGSIKLVQYYDYSKAMDLVTRRAWIMQESLLAPRMLSYSYQSIAWSCRKANHSDGGPSRKWYDFEDRMMWAKLKNEMDLRICMRKWNRLVESYTSRTLSDSNDRLPAISGIVQKYVHLLQRHLPADWNYLVRLRYRLEGKDVECADYVAGLWYCKLSPLATPIMFSQQLIWGTSYYKAYYQSTGDNPGPAYGAFNTPTLADACNSTAPTSATTNSRNPDSQAHHNCTSPSWSWASIEEPIQYGRAFGGFTSAPDFAIIACETELEFSIAPFGNVRSGRLTVQGSLIPVTNLSHWRWVVRVRPDNPERAVVLSKTMSEKRTAWS